MLGLRNAGVPNITSPLIHEETNEPVANDFNWVDQGKVNAIKDQGGCGSCWAFSATAASESSHAIRHGELYRQSEQQLVDCTFDYGNYGCGGGWYYYAWNYQQNYGQMMESSYPY